MDDRLYVRGYSNMENGFRVICSNQQYANDPNDNRAYGISAGSWAVLSGHEISPESYTNYSCCMTGPNSAAWHVFFKNGNKLGIYKLGFKGRVADDKNTYYDIPIKGDLIKELDLTGMLDGYSIINYGFYSPANKLYILTNFRGYDISVGYKNEADRGWNLFVIDINTLSVSRFHITGMDGHYNYLNIRETLHDDGKIHNPLTYSNLFFYAALIIRSTAEYSHYFQCQACFAHAQW